MTKPEPPLQTGRLVLRELTDSDFGAVHAYASDPEVVRYMPWGPNSEAETREFIKRAQTMAAAQPRVGYELAVTVRQTGELIGAIGLHRERAQENEAMLGYCFGQPAWGHGYATEAGQAMVEFGLRSLGLESVWAGCDSDNSGSIRVLEKLGMTLQSKRRDETDPSSESLMFCISK